MVLNWRSLYYGKVTKDEVREAIQDGVWQRLRQGLKGMPLDFKYSALCGYRAAMVQENLSAHEWRMVEVRLTNYVTALSRGGLIKPTDYRN